MTDEEIFRCFTETDEEYIARTTEEERCREAAAYIQGIYIGGNYEEDYTVEGHVDDLKKRGLLSPEKAKELKTYLAGFVAGFETANKERDRREQEDEMAEAMQEILP